MSKKTNNNYNRNRNNQTHRKKQNNQYSYVKQHTPPTTYMSSDYARSSGNPVTSVQNNLPDKESFKNRRNNSAESRNIHNNYNYHHDPYAEDERKFRETRLIRQGIDEVTDLLTELLRKQSSEPQEITSEKQEKVAIFVDGSNIRYAISSINNSNNQSHSSTIQFDARKLCTYIENNIGQITDAYYYDAADRADGMDLNFTQNNGFAQIFKQVKVIQVGEGKTSKKCNLDVEIVLDMMATINHYDICVLLSGDSDFKRPLEVLKSMGKKFVVISTRNSISRELLYLSGRHLLLIDEHPEWFTEVQSHLHSR